jgi:protein-S-isoprenylcysteine O-methyltransferase Ste14
LCEWATIPLLIMWPVLVWLYVRLARREEADMAAEFGPAYATYRERTGMFLPRLWGPRPMAQRRSA